MSLPPHPGDTPHPDDVPALADSDAPAPKPRKPEPGSTDGPLTPSADESQPAKSGSGSQTGASTSGFDTMLGKKILAAGLITEDELDQCRVEAGEEASDRTLSDLLVERHLMTDRQLERLRKEFEASKSSQKIPGYRIMKKLGAGAMASVFLAEQKRLHRLVAIKVLPRRFSEDQNFIDRFYKEGRAAAKLNHPNIVQAYDVNQAGDHHYFVMEYVEGETVYDRIQKRKRIPEDEAITILIQSAKALHHAHEKGFVHRDIKPKNLMLTTSDQVKVADLGLARNLEDTEAAEQEKGRAYGTPFYISPEQIRGELTIGPAADIYGLGATAYHMVTGHVPFSGKNPSDVMRQHLKTELKPPDQANPALSSGFCQVIEMMLAKNRADRYVSAADLVTDLELVSRNEEPRFAKPKFDLGQLAVSVSGPNEPTELRAAPKRSSGNTSPVFVASIVLNVLLLATIVVVALLK
ncbi:MAG: serine/threonine protein kinase [Phycisphaerales bacterium]|nr:serine/threonine protein kinase [Phycisphaerales bacterium]